MSKGIKACQTQTRKIKLQNKIIVSVMIMELACPVLIVQAMDDMKFNLGL